ncbi:unnamed protein product [Blepharisma stoltei]|uniref:C2H2-type domain-containing protein n=1 Tax=Blepharisma stoltei TaxID=1481888 RepID=A0AAU9K1C3_9CILI|nr:unnamed protein product [Blepharisma stoltei]
MIFFCIPIINMKTSQPTSDQLILYCCMENDCGKTFITKFNLKRHCASVHLKTKNFKCNYCHKFFSSKQNLDEHIFIHTGERPFTCEICQISFRQISQLSLHKRNHSKVFIKNNVKNVTNPMATVDKNSFNIQEASMEIEEHKAVSTISSINLPLLNSNRVSGDAVLPAFLEIIGEYK